MIVTEECLPLMTVNSIALLIESMHAWPRALILLHGSISRAEDTCDLKPHHTRCSQQRRQKHRGVYMQLAVTGLVRKHTRQLSVLTSLIKESESQLIL